LLLLDADVIVFAHELGVWDSLKKAYDVHVPSIVIEVEVRFFTSLSGGRRIDLKAQAHSSEIKRVEATALQIYDTFKDFDPTFMASLHDGEKEGITILRSSAESGLVFCTGDIVAIQSVGMLGLSGTCISFEELLEKAGLLKGLKLLPSLRKREHESHLAKGKTRRITGECFKKPPF
jgi:hypothetical protein